MDSLVQLNLFNFKVHSKNRQNKDLIGKRQLNEGRKYCRIITDYAKVYTTHTSISITIKIFIGLSALNLSLWHSITFDIFLQIQRKVQLSLKMQCAITFYANHSLDGPMDARCSENSKFHPKYHVYFSLILKDQKHEMCLRNKLSAFNYSFETRL